MRDVSYRVALGGIVAALCLVTMFLAGVIPALYLVLPMTAGVLLMIIAEEVSRSWALLTYVAVGILSLFITFDKEAALIFIMLFGHYPIVRLYISKVPLRVLRVGLKLLISNVCIIAYFFVTVYIFGLDQLLDEMGDYGRYGAYILLGMANAVFIMYDFNLESAYKLYRKRLAPKFKRKR